MIIDWDLLEIEPTKDIPAIKKAYAKQLKKNHPEDNPVGYQKLREAYNNAVKYAKNPVEKEAYSVEHIEFELNQDADIHTSPIQPFLSTPSLSFYEQILSIYEDYTRRIDINEWKGLLDQEEIWNVELFERNKRVMTRFLEEHHHLPREVWEWFNQIFHWQSWNQDFFQTYVQSHNNLRFQYIKDMEKDHDLFLNYRDNVYSGLTGQTAFDPAELQKAMELFDRDPDLLKMQAHYYKELKEWELALETYYKAIEIEPEEWDCYAERVRIYTYLENWQIVIKEASDILEKIPNHQIKIHLAKAYSATENWEKALEIIEQILAEEKNNLEANLLYAQIPKSKKLIVQNEMVQKEMAPFSWKERIKLFRKFLFIPWLILISVITFIIHVSLTDDIERHTGLDLVGWMQNLFQSVEVMKIDSVNQLEDLEDTPHSFVTLSIQDARHTGLYETLGKRVEWHTRERGFYNIEDATYPENLLEDDAKPIFVGYLGDTAIIFTQSLEDIPVNLPTTQSFDTIVTGEWRPIDNHSDSEAVTNRVESKVILSKDDRTAPVITDMYADGAMKLDEPMSFLNYPFIALLLFLYSYIIFSIYRGCRIAFYREVRK
ncbi:hypothetical protein F9U64_00670 [Gracilibacillus oryzae]|uniref:Tetratricopeptide repeat protein n=1 Tax=Gracilibacillus oryzae TaxID=1672701 RepID=A0A7C8GVK2_9BACI|nr:hypothetical protein [Gracilibacillus oryzae]KAB8139340.1 hypothetical protein F9U64_00670 [Gracilibacillus oryzae]